MTTVIEVRRGDLSTTRTTRATLPELEDGDVLLRVEEFALTANTITYARLGDELGYWRVFPSPGTGWGRIPAWGTAEVIASAHPDIAIGRRLFGYVPMGSHLVLRPSRVGEPGLTEGSAHRATLSAAYNNYQWLEPGEEPSLRAVLLPVFALSFLLDAFVAEQFTGHAIVVSSASSKAALGLAHRLAKRGVPITGLTSTANAAFTRSLNIYQDVLAYQDIPALPRESTVFLDVAGNPEVGRAVRARLGDHLAHWTRAGFTHGSATPSGDTWFFVPDELRSRVRAWGGAEYTRRFGAALAEFTEWAATWLKLAHVDGPEAVTDAYRRLLDGHVDPDTALLGTI
jgi:hypothetical protein